MNTIPATYPIGDAEKASDSAFPSSELVSRYAAIRRRMAASGLDILITMGAENIFYLSGHQTPGYYMFQCLCVPLDDEPFLVVRELEVANAVANAHIDSILYYDDEVDPYEFLIDQLVGKGYSNKNLGIDLNSWFLKVNGFKKIEARLPNTGDAGSIIDQERLVKSAFELEQIRKAAGIVEMAMRVGVDSVQVGRNENDVAAAIVDETYRRGSEYVAMDPFVCAGRRSGLRHATWRRQNIQDGDIVTVEISACWNRYHSALFRTVPAGTARNQAAMDMLWVCEEGLNAGLEKLIAGDTPGAVHGAILDVVTKRGYFDNFRKRSGYSMGIAFAPDWGDKCGSLNFGNERVLEEGMVFHIPVSLCHAGRHTVCTSETVIVRNGRPEILNNIPRILVEETVGG